MRVSPTSGPFGGSFASEFDAASSPFLLFRVSLALLPMGSFILYSLKHPCFDAPPPDPPLRNTCHFVIWTVSNPASILNKQ